MSAESAESIEALAETLVKVEICDDEKKKVEEREEAPQGTDDSGETVSAAEPSPSDTEPVVPVSEPAESPTSAETVPAQMEQQMADLADQQMSPTDDKIAFSSGTPAVTTSPDFPSDWFTEVQADSPDLLLGVQTLGLCALSYNNRYLLEETIFHKTNDLHEASRKAKIMEQKWRRAIGVLDDDDEDYKVWNERNERLTNGLGKAYLESQCITGVIENVESTDERKGKQKVPFVVFRGSVSVTDWVRDLMSIITEKHITEQGHITEGEVGKGFRKMLNELQNEIRTETPNESERKTALRNGNTLSKGTRKNLMDEILRLVRKYDSGLIICGHSLGGACANIFLTEFALDYRHLVEKYGRDIRMVTFGSPRAVSVDVARWLDSLPITYLRFVNNDDLVSDLPPKSMTSLVHAGKALYPYIPSRATKLKETKDPLRPDVLPDWDGQTDDERNNSRWMVVYQCDNEQHIYGGIDNFSADGKADHQWTILPSLPEGFLKRITMHSLVHKQGYLKHFQNYNNPTLNEFCSVFFDFNDKLEKLLKEDDEEIAKLLAAGKNSLLSKINSFINPSR